MAGPRRGGGGRVRTGRVIRHFVRLKFVVTSHTLRRGDVWATLGVVGIWAAAVGIGLGGGALAAIGFEILGGVEAPIAVAVVLHVAWAVVPLMASAMDATLDPRSFEELPLTSGRLSRGLLAASATGPGGLATVLFVSVGYGVGLWPGWIGLVTLPLLAVLMVLVSVASGRLVTTIVSDLLTGSRIGEMASLVAGLVSAGSVLAATSMLPTGGILTELALPAWVRWLAVLPSGAAGAAFSRFHAGSWLAGGGSMLWSAAGLAVLVWAHGRALDRLQTRSVTSRAGRVRSDVTVLGTRLGRVVWSPVIRAAAAKELRYLGRDPRIRAQLLGGFVTVVVFGFVAASTFATPLASFLAVLATWAVVAALVPNQFGTDGGTFWAYAAAPTPLSAAIAGKNVAWALATAPVTLAVGVGGSWVGGSGRHLPTALVGSAIIFLVWTAVGNLTSIYGAFPLPERQLFGANAGGSGRSVVVSLVGLAVSGVLTAPPAVGIGVAIFLAGPSAGLAASAAGLLYAMLLYAVTWRLVAPIADERRFALTDVLDGS